MLSERRWRPDAALLLASGLLLSMMFGSLLKFWLDQQARNQSPGAISFLGFLIGLMSFQGAALILLHFFIKVHQVSWKDFLGLKSGNLKWAIKVAVLAAILAIPLTFLLQQACAWIISLFSGHPEEQFAIKVLQKTLGWGQRISFGLFAIVLAPIVEEGLFRGILYPLVKQYAGPMLALSSTSLLFAAIHANLLTFVPLTVLAMILVLLYEKTDTLLAPIVTHALSNAVNFTLFFILPAK